MSKETIKIAVQERKDFGKNASRRARRAGMIPAAVYSKGKETQAFLVNADEWQAFSANHASHMVTLAHGSVDIPALVKEVQFNYLKNYVLHIDFQEVNLNEDIVSSVAIHAHGEAVGAAHGGILEQELHELEVICHPADLPEMLHVDVSKLEIGQSLHVSDIVLPAGVKCEMDPETVVFHVARPQLEEEPSAATEEVTEPEVIKEKKAEE